MKNKLFLSFGILLLLFAIAVPFLIASNGSDDLKSFIGEDNPCLGDHSGQFGSVMESGFVTFNEDCGSKTDLSKFLGDKAKLTVEGGATLSREKFGGDFILTFSGEEEGTVEIGDPPKKLFLENGDQIKIASDGKIIQGKFKSDEGEIYDFEEFLIRPSTAGKVEFDLNAENPFLILPDHSVLENLDFKDGSLTVEGNGITVSKELANKFLGGAPEGFGWDGPLKIDNAIGISPKGAKNQMFVLKIPLEEQIHFPGFGMTVKNKGKDGYDLPIVFGKDSRGFSVAHPEFEHRVLGDHDYYLGDDLPYESGFLSFGQDKIDINVVETNLHLTFDEGSNYAGFNVEPGEFLSFEVSQGQATFQEGKATFHDTDSTFSMINGHQKILWERDSAYHIWNGGKEGSPVTDFEILIKGEDNHNYLGVLDKETGLTVIAWDDVKIFSQEDKGGKVSKLFVIYGDDTTPTQIKDISLKSAGIAGYYTLKENDMLERLAKRDGL